MKNNTIKQFLVRFSLLLAISLPSGAVYSAESDILREIKSLREDTIREIKNLREDMNKRFEQVDKRFEQVDKRFESVQSQMDGRFNQMMWFIGIWIPLSMAVVGYMLQRLNRHDDRFFEISRKSIEAEDMITAINKAKPETRKRLKEALKG
ncbi:MAG: hypothetical protein OEV66_02165 [Spirochaetia bacterium]|nr:hypothetical protein [Spirochaetia bacterium]